MTLKLNVLKHQTWVISQFMWVKNLETILLISHEVNTKVLVSNKAEAQLEKSMSQDHLHVRYHFPEGSHLLPVGWRLSSNS
jgi:hypothetical protein